MDYYKDSEKVNEYVKMAEGHDSTDLIEELKEFTKSKSSILEIGSGPGNAYSVLLKHFDTVVGSDFSYEFLYRLIERYPEGTFFELDAKDLDIDMKFDILFSNKVLHHLNDEELNQSFSRQVEILNESGIICHTFWKGEGTEDYEGMFVNLHSIEELESILKANFSILKIGLYKEFEEDDSIFVIAQKV